MKYADRKSTQKRKECEKLFIVLHTPTYTYFSFVRSKRYFQTIINHRFLFDYAGLADIVTRSLDINASHIFYVHIICSRLFTRKCCCNLMCTYYIQLRTIRSPNSYTMIQLRIQITTYYNLTTLLFYKTS